MYVYGIYIHYIIYVYIYTDLDNTDMQATVFHAGWTLRLLLALQDRH